MLSCIEIEADSPVVSTLIHVRSKFVGAVNRFVRLLDELNVLEKSPQSGNMDAVARFAHWLKGSGGNVGFDGFVMLASALEQTAPMQGRQEVAERVNQVYEYAKRAEAGRNAIALKNRAA